MIKNLLNNAILTYANISNGTQEELCSGCGCICPCECSDCEYCSPCKDH